MRENGGLALVLNEAGYAAPIRQPAAATSWPPADNSNPPQRARSRRSMSGPCPKKECLRYRAHKRRLNPKRHAPRDGLVRPVALFLSKGEQTIQRLLDEMLRMFQYFRESLEGSPAFWVARRRTKMAGDIAGFSLTGFFSGKAGFSFPPCGADFIAPVIDESSRGHYVTMVWLLGHSNERSGRWGSFLLQK